MNTKKMKTHFPWVDPMLSHLINQLLRLLLINHVIVKSQNVLSCIVSALLTTNSVDQAVPAMVAVI